MRVLGPHRPRRAGRARRRRRRHHAHLDLPRGQVDLAAISSLFAPDMGPFFVRTTAVSVENTHNFAGGAVLPLADLEALRSWATSVGVAVHLDGARIWNAHVATGTPLASYGAQADVLCVCFSKGLGAPSARCWSGRRPR